MTFGFGNYFFSLDARQTTFGWTVTNWYNESGLPLVCIFISMSFKEMLALGS